MEIHEERIRRKIRRYGFELSAKDHETMFSDGSVGAYYVLQLLDNEDEIITECYTIMRNQGYDNRGINQISIPRIFDNPQEALDMLVSTGFTAPDAIKHTEMQYRSDNSRTLLNRRINKLMKLEELV